MGATEILQALKGGKSLTAPEISAIVECSLNSVQVGVKRLLKDVSENLEVRVLTSEEKQQRYGRKIGCKINIYWLDE